MPIQQTTAAAAVNNHIAKRLEALDKAVRYNLGYIAELVLNAARSTNSYKDQTGNLRSSIGYVMVKDGRIVEESSFNVVNAGATGAKEGRDFAEQLARNFNTGYALIFVAGMNYAYYVSAKGYDVLDSAELLAKQVVPQILKRLGF